MAIVEQPVFPAVCCLSSDGDLSFGRAPRLVSYIETLARAARFVCTSACEKIDGCSDLMRENTDL